MTADSYVAQVLFILPPFLPQRDQIASEVRAHIDEAMSAGRSLDEALTGLGTPRALAESYLREMPQTPAPFGRRIGAAAVDLGIALAVFALMAVLMWLSFSVSIGLVILPAVALLTTPLLFFFYVTLSEAKYGQTIGKRKFRLGVAKESGARIRFSEAVVRRLPWVLQIFWIDIFFAFFTERRQRAFEMLSKTMVVDCGHD